MNGIHLDLKKEASLVTWVIKRPRSPKAVYIPLRHTEEDLSIPCVKAGDKVKIGQKIADPADSHSVAKHASVSGTIVQIARYPHPVMGETEAIEIRSNGLNEVFEGVGKTREPLTNISKEACLKIFREMGLVDLSDTNKPLHLKALAQKGHSIHTMIINGCQSEPYVTSNHALMMSNPVEILKGVDILKKVFGAKKVVIALQEQSLEAAELLRSKIYFLRWNDIEVKVLSDAYPQGMSEILIPEVIGEEPYAYQRDGSPRAEVIDLATALSVYEAVVLQKPLVERAVTVGGECVVESQNVWAPLGTSFDETFKFCRGLLREPRKVLMGGPLKGTAQPNLRMPVIGATQAILALPKEVAKPENVDACIRCHRCVEACPTQISPVMITLAAEKNLFDMARDAGAELCIECGNCAYVCPAQRPMTELIRYAATYLEPDKRFSEPTQPETPEEWEPAKILRKKIRSLADINS